MDTKKRSIAKAVSYRVFGTLTTGTIAWFFTGKIEVSLAIGLFDATFKIAGYFLHERIWAKLSYGKGKDIEYQI